MVRLKKILFQAGETDWSSAALDRAATLAWRTQASLTIAGSANTRRNEASSSRERLAVCDQRLEALASPLREYGLNVNVQVLRGDPVKAICREAAANQYDLVALPFEMTGGLKERLLGSTAARVARLCPTAVWAVKRPFGGCSRILAAIDPGAEDAGKRALCAKVLEWAATLARIDESELHVVHAWRVYGEWLIRSRIRPEEFIGYVKGTKRVAERAFHRALSGRGLAVAPRNLHFLKGEPPLIIPALAAKIGAGLVVLGMEGRTGLQGLLVGNTAEKIMLAGGCSVFTVRRDGSAGRSVAAA